MTARTEFLTNRQKGIGGSDIAAICGLSTYATPYDVWLSKVEPKSIEEEEAERAEKPWLYWGAVLEDIVAKEFATREGVKVQRVNRQMQHPIHHFAIANVDRAIIVPEIAGNVRWKDGRLTTNRLLECKTANGFAANRWGEQGTDEIPPAYFCQCQWYMGITGAERTDVAVLIGGSDFRTYKIPADPKIFETLLGQAKDFWKLVESRTAPDPQTVADIVARWPRHQKGKEAIASTSVMAAVADYNRISEQIKELEAAKDAAKVIIGTAMEDAEILIDMGQSIATYKAQTAQKLDAKALRADHPEIAALYTSESTSRVLRIK